MSRFRLTGPSEHEIQSALFEWAGLACRHYPELRALYAVPNGGKRSIGAARYMIAEGLRTGVPDVCLPVPRKGFGALYIEHKRPGEKPTPAQAAWIALLTELGNKCAVSTSFADSRTLLLDYLSR